MLTHFPVAQKDELLTSILARFIQQMGIKDDKVALDILFGNRMVVPSPFLQGHIAQLLDHVGQVWGVHPRLIVERHSHLPLFKPFLSPNQYKTLQADLIYSSANPSMSRSGIPASVIQWPKSYKICPQCWQEQSKTLGFTYWQRLFQSPGVKACPEHQCTLLDTNLFIHSTHRHHFIGSNYYECSSHLSEGAQPYELKLACMVETLLNSKLDYVSPKQWTIYYQQLAKNEGAMNGARIDHKGIANLLRKTWSDEWLNQQGLALSGGNTWLVAMFRKHRRSYSYLQHFIVWLSFDHALVDLCEVFNRARKLSTTENHTSATVSTKNVVKRDEVRTQWLGILESSCATSLKNIRTTDLGARLYSWLYRYDSRWLNKHKPDLVTNYQNNRVDWRLRDLLLVKKLIKTKNRADDRVEDPRHSKLWFASSIEQKSLVEKKLYKLPLCSLFFDRYSESIEEYQIRRLSRVMVQLIEHKDILRPMCEIERLAGLSRTRSRKPAREVLRLDIPAWQRAQALS
ncbi:TnsD family Tn7-like transposition protein [Vibrio sp. nBUS_14]|uniref:TnsD family Tn7-like transposition protein n=1 Tax=Vibrio sp. nBUS_14 TaxID=3395321 RepID=UPI003EC0D81B